MDPNEWKHEMNRMLDSFASQAEHSLGKINRCFETMGRPFDDDFRKYYLEVSNQRLDISFKTVLFSKAPVRGNETESSTNDPSGTKKQSPNPLKTENDVDSIEICDSDDDNHLDMRPDWKAGGMQHGPANGQSTEAKPFIQVEPNRGNEDNSTATMIEIYDSDDEEQQLGTETNVDADANKSQVEMNESVAAVMQDVPKTNRNDSQIGVNDFNDENDVKPYVKEESNANNAIELAEIPLVRFDPNGGSDSTVAVKGKSGNSAAQQTGSSSSRKKSQSKYGEYDKRFKCKHCDCSFPFKNKLKQHQPVHANGKLIGVKADANGMYQCTLCVRRFFNAGILSRHMDSHKNNQRLHYCARCLCEFDREAAKDRHEIRCEGRHFECHLCKVYVSKVKRDMQRHMRTHSGAKPFQCMVCNKHFQGKSGLKFHLNSIHSHNK